MCPEQAMEFSWEISELDPSWAMWWGFWLEIYRRTPNRRCRWDDGLKMEQKGTWGMIWGSPREFSVGPELGKV